VAHVVLDLVLLELRGSNFFHLGLRLLALLLTVNSLEV
jgi:hypothetical protein